MSACWLQIKNSQSNFASSDPPTGIICESGRIKLYQSQAIEADRKCNASEARTGENDVLQLRISSEIKLVSDTLMNL